MPRFHRTAALSWPLALLALAVGRVAGADGAANFAEIRPQLEKYCYECHGDKKQKGGVNLAKVKGIEDVQHDPAQWEDVLQELRDGEMPPKMAKEQLAPDQRDKLMAWVERTLDSLDAGAQVRDPGRVTLHRLNRVEYNNTIRDLLDVDLRPADQFPADGVGGGGFDNNADTLFLPPLLLEKLVEAANAVLEAAKPERLAIVKPADDKPKTRREAARATAAAFAKRAYRRPVAPAEVDRLLKVFDYCEKKSIAYDDGVRHMLKAALMSPSFLYRAEEAKKQVGAFELGQYEMAARLSYFLWSSMPDEALFALAEQKKLQDPRVIAEQVARMLKDPKAKALAQNFTGQWLLLEQLRSGAIGPDPQKYPEFTQPVREALCGEPAAFMAGLINGNRSILELIDSDYTWMNGEVAHWYGVSGPTGAEFQEVKLPDANRGGVMGMAAVLAATSHPQRTSPVLRGKWMLAVMLNAPTPPPPPNVAQLAKDDGAKEEQSLRKRLEKHRADPGCAGCHSRIDPLGFGLENFDVVGAWRTQDARGEAIDNTGTLPGGASFSGPAELRKILMGKKDQFTRAFTEKLLSYALGRGIEGYDRQTVKEIAQATAKDGYRLPALITAIAVSYPFRNARVAALAPAATAPEPAK